MRRRLEHLDSDEGWRNRLSPEAAVDASVIQCGGRRGDDDGDSWGKKTARTQGLATRKKANGGVKWRLVGGKRQAVSYLMEGKELRRGKISDQELLS
jgi:hypothetical protein